MKTPDSHAPDLPDRRLDPPGDPSSPANLLTDAILEMYEEVVENPEGDFHFHHGRDAALRFGYDPEAIDRLPAGAVAAFAGVGNPHLRAAIRPGETVLDVGCGAGLDALLAGHAAGAEARVIGIDMNPAMLDRARTHAAQAGVSFEGHLGRMESLPIGDTEVDVVISNGVVNLSMDKPQVFREVFRVLRPGGRLSLTDIVSGRELSPSIVNDPKLWAS